MAEITHCQQGATGEQIRQLEAALGQELPPDYAAFLRQYNGGIPTPNVFPIQGSPRFKWDQIDHFLSLGVPEEYLDLLQTMERVADRLPSGYVPIGNSSCSTMLILSTNAKDFGRVYYWDYCDLADDGGPAVWPVARSFADLLGALTEDSEGGDASFGAGTESR